MTSLQKEVIIGTMLGDASIERVKLTHNARIRFDQTYPKHSSYIELLYSILNNLVLSGPKVHTLVNQMLERVKFIALLHLRVEIYLV